MNCGERKDLLLLYAAGALDEREGEELRAHLLSGCPRCAGHLAEARATLAHLPLALDPVAPPASVRERLMERVAATAPEGFTAPGVERTAPAGEPVPFRKEPSRAEGPAKPSFIVAWVRPALAAAVAAALAYFAALIPMRDRQSELETRVALQDRQLARQNDEIAALRSDLTTAMETAAFFRARVLDLVLLQGGESQPDAWGRIAWDRVEDKWLFHAFGLRPAGPGKTYQLWFITPDERKISAGTFDVDHAGVGALRVGLPEGVEPALAAVTDEPAGGVPQPTGSIQLLARL